VIHLYYGRIAKPLTQLLKKGIFVWTAESTEAMQQLKTAVTTAPVLMMPDLSQPFCIRRAQDQMSKFANYHRSPSPIKVGDMVYLKIQPHQQLSMPNRLHPKLAAKYYGSFPVVAAVGSMAFRLQLPDPARIHPVFHVSQLKLALGPHEVQLELPKEFQGQAVNFYPTEILDRRELSVQGAYIPQILIKWNEGDRDTATWEDVTTIKEQFPKFYLEDKVALTEGSNVRTKNKEKTWKVYYRRNVKK